MDLEYHLEVSSLLLGPPLDPCGAGTGCSRVPHGHGAYWLGRGDTKVPRQLARLGGQPPLERLKIIGSPAYGSWKHLRLRSLEVQLRSYAF